MILYIMVCGTMPFDDSNIKKMIRDQMDQRISFNKKRTVTQLFRDCILAILHPDPEKRLTVERMMDDPWVSDTSGCDVIDDVIVNNTPLGESAPPSQVVTVERTTEVVEMANRTPRSDIGRTVVIPSRRRAARDDDSDESTSGESSNKLPRL